MYKVSAILLLGGTSLRMDGFCGDKNLVSLGNKPVFFHSLRLFDSLSIFREIVIVYRDVEQRIVLEKILREFQIRSKIELVQGGSSRQNSVMNALLYLENNPPDITLIHDAARPLVTRENIYALMDSMDECDAAILAHRATDTLIEISGEKRNYLPREKIWHMETPQMFKYDLILEAHRTAKLNNRILFDDSSALANSTKLKVVENTSPNIKLTYPKDLPLIEAILGNHEN